MQDQKTKDHCYYSDSVVNVSTQWVWHAAYFMSECDPQFSAVSKINIYAFQHELFVYTSLLIRMINGMWLMR